MKERPILFSGPMVREILAGRKTQTRRPVKNLRVRLRHEVSSDLPALVRPVVTARVGAYPAKLNLAGAVSVELPREPGSAVRPFLGVKPQEFDFVCPYADGHTYLRRHPDGRMAWHLQVAEGQRLWVRETFSLDRLTVYPCPPAWYRADFMTWEVTDHDECNPPTTCKRGLTGDCLHGLHWKPAIHMPRKLSRLLLEVESVRVERLQAITEEDARAEGMETFLLPMQVPTCRDVLRLRWDEMYGGGDFEWDRSPWVWVVTFRPAPSSGDATNGSKEG